MDSKVKKSILGLLIVFGCLIFTTHGCEESCRFSYDGSFKESRQRCDQTTTGNVVVTDRATFDGSSYLSLPMFQQNPLRPAFAIAFIFKYTGMKSNKDVAVLSNGCEDVDPTMEFRISQRRGKFAATTLNLRMTNDDRDMNITVWNQNVDVYREVLVQIAQNETTLEIEVAGQPRQSFAKDVNDYIMQTPCALQVGAGNGLENFIGEFDEFLYYPCVNPGFFGIFEFTDDGQLTEDSY